MILTADSRDFHLKTWTNLWHKTRTFFGRLTTKHLELYNFHSYQLHQEYFIRLIKNWTLSGFHPQT